MGKITSLAKKVLPAVALYIFCFGMNGAVYAQNLPTLSVSYDYLPSQKLSSPDAGTWLEDLEIQVATLNLSISYPLVFSQGKTVLANEISYHRLDFDYKNWNFEIDPQGGVERAYAIEYTLTWLQWLWHRWSLLALIAPGLASDFEGDITSDDFIFQTAAVFIYKFSQRFSLGFGAAYSTQFGEPFPLPVLALEWNNGTNLHARSIFPVNLEAWYLLNKTLELGALIEVDGNQYHGDPEIYAPTENPQLRYSIGLAGLSTKAHLSKVLHLNLFGGYTFHRRVEFYDGDTEAASYNLKNTGFFKASMQLGG